MTDDDDRISFCGPLLSRDPERVAVHAKANDIILKQGNMLRLVWAMSEMSAAELTRLTGLDKQTLHDLVLRPEDARADDFALVWAALGVRVTYGIE